MKKRYTLTESRLRNIIKEAVRGMINELDITSMPRFNDARDRDAWWKEQILKDFPEKKYLVDRQVGNFQDLYYRLRDEQEKSEQMRAKQERQNARTARQQEKQQMRQEKEAAKRKNRSLFLNTVAYVVLGEDALMSVEQIMGDIDNEIPADWYDGVSKIPVIIRSNPNDRSARKDVWAKIYGWSEGAHTSYGYISSGWNMEIDGLGENGDLYMKFTIQIIPNRKEIQFMIDEYDNDIIDARMTEKFVTKYLNGVVRRKYKEAVAKIEKYGTADVTGW